METRLNEYLAEIDHFLILKEGKTEVLREIRSHILDKTERDFGELTDENIQHTIDSFGSTQKVAEQYSEGYQIISPAYKNYLFRYTWLLFGLHYLLKLVSYFFDMAFNFTALGVSINVRHLFQLVSEAPSTWIYSFGIVALVLYFITQSEKEVNLIWPEFARNRFKVKTLPLSKPSLTKVIVFTVLLLAALYVNNRYNTLFFMTVNLQTTPTPLFAPIFSQFMSQLVIALLCFELICAVMPYFLKSYWVNIINNLVYILVAAFLLQHPFKEVFIKPELNELAPIGIGIMITVIVFSAIDLFKALVSMLRTSR